MRDRIMQSAIAVSIVPDILILIGVLWFRCR